jgi:hypothetical protein
MFDTFWWSSAMARYDTKDSLALVRERRASGNLRSMLPPEEVTTFNLVRRLASQQIRKDGTVAAAQHSRPLEGGTRGRPASGTDLELAVEVYPGGWVDLLIQAKRIFPRRGGPAVYQGWKVTQIQQLRSWAQTNGQRTPGLLLYNADVPPFGARPTVVAQGACCSSPVRCNGSSWPRHRRGMNGESPLAITLVVLPSYANLVNKRLFRDRPEVAVVNDSCLPVEVHFLSKQTVPCKPSGAITDWWQSTTLGQ